MPLPDGSPGFVRVIFSDGSQANSSFDIFGSGPEDGSSVVEVSVSASFGGDTPLWLTHGASVMVCAAFDDFFIAIHEGCRAVRVPVTEETAMVFENDIMPLIREYLAVSAESQKVFYAAAAEWVLAISKGVLQGSIRPGDMLPDRPARDPEGELELVYDRVVDALCVFVEQHSPEITATRE